jgi:hypothetical protein
MPEEQQEQQPSKPIEVKICATHGKDSWQSHDGYIQNEDGSVSCIYCPWGCFVPGYMRVYNGKMMDLRHYKALAN